ncbi:MAG TPA: hypothetical protein VKY31_00055 [Terriglobia bacterium]|nr:hypothetical protein [Terriglobia bacterium]
MMDFLRAIEQSGFSQWVVGSSSVFAFPSILLLHTIGMGVVVGINAGISLRILGYAPAVPLAPLERFLPLFWVGFWVNATTGVILLAADATTKAVNPDFYVKMIFIALAVINLKALRKRVFGDPLIDKVPPSMNVKVLAITSLIFWLGAITAGRLLAYVGPVSGLSK